MRAIVLTGYGGVDKLELRDLPEPKVGPGEVKVRVAGASINPIDWKIRSGAFKERMPLEFPTIIGRDASGEVVEVGAGVSELKSGVRVMGLVMGAYAERVVAKTEAWAELPAQLDLVDARSAPSRISDRIAAHRGGRRPARGRHRAGDRCGRRCRTRGRVHREVMRGQGVGWRAARAESGGGEARRGWCRRARRRSGEMNRIPRLDGIADTVGGETIRKLLARVKPGGAIGSVLGAPAGAKERRLVVHGMYVRPIRSASRRSGGWWRQGSWCRSRSQEATCPRRSAGEPKPTPRVARAER